MSNLIIVESPSKAKTINKYLGSEFIVLSSYGHIRDLPSKDGSVNPNKNFQMIWQQNNRGKKQVQLIKNTLKNIKILYLATDPDREGEAISWHILNILKKYLKLKIVYRIIFNEITKEAIKYAINHPKKLNHNLINAYLTRRALDYLVGFKLSPILWRKIPGSKSAGRVQSAALNIISDKESLIDHFISQKYWSITGYIYLKTQNKTITVKLTKFKNQQLNKLSLTNENIINKIKQYLYKNIFYISSLETKQIKRNPQPPFTTSTLQQEASNQLGFNPRKTMKLSQKLYEGLDIGKNEIQGLITYMRTDNVSISSSAISICRKSIKNIFGNNYLPKKPIIHTTKSKNSQEAHEAIRPTNFDLTPESLKSIIEKDLYKLYDLIWKKCIASQMNSTVINKYSMKLTNNSTIDDLCSTKSKIIFDGFLKVYDKEQTNNKKNIKENIFTKLKKDEKIIITKIISKQHTTQPPTRYNEATLIKKLETVGIGRPSTYETILNTLQIREYVKIKNRYFYIEPRGRIVTSFLTQFFNQYVTYNFTATLENQLDEISNGNLNWKKVLYRFWNNFKLKIKIISQISNTDVINKLNDKLLNIFIESQDCPACKKGSLSLKNGKYGVFIGCSRYPICSITKNIEQQTNINKKEIKVLGNDPNTKELILLRNGPYGLYLQWGEKVKNTKPQYISIPKNYTKDQITLKIALDLKNLPKNLGIDIKNNKNIYIGLGRFGPYIKIGNKFTSIPKTDDILQISLKRVLEILKQNK